MKRILPLIPIVAVLGLGALFGIYGLHHDPQVQPNALVGKPLPSIALTPIKGGAPQTVAQTVKGPALVNFFFSTCVPCTIEAPQLMKLKANGIQLVGVAYKDEPGNTLAFLDRLGNPFSDVLTDRQGDAGIEFGITGAPETFIVDAKGQIVAKHVGVISDADVADLTARIHALQKTGA
jgi:cytochrome c biogenesis protein CcmG/thiol:disulfide interchange protein DsbE